MAENETPKVGDTVYGSFGRYGATDVREGKVVKVTPTGRLNVDFGQRGYSDGTPIIRQFKDSREVGGDMWHAARLISREAYEERLEHQRGQDAMKSFIARLRSWKVNNKADAIALADEIKALADAIPDGYEA